MAHDRRLAGDRTKAVPSSERSTSETAASARAGRSAPAASLRIARATERPIAARSASKPSPADATVGTTSTPSQSPSFAASTVIPAAAASSIMLRATTTGTPVSTICSTR